MPCLESTLAADIAAYPARNSFKVQYFFVPRKRVTAQSHSHRSHSCITFCTRRHRTRAISIRNTPPSSFWILNHVKYCLCSTLTNHPSPFFIRILLVSALDSLIPPVIRYDGLNTMRVICVWCACVRFGWLKQPEISSHLIF